MIKQVIFDFGQVLVHYDPSYITAQYIENEEDRKAVEEVMFDRLYWDKLDQGTITDEELIASARKRLPERLWEKAEAAYLNWHKHLPEVEGMKELIQRIKREYGVRIFVLSNISKGFAAHANELPIFREAELCVFSAVCGYTKPHAEIFAYLCEKANILPSESLFVDDSKKNIEGARAYGITGYLFDGDVKKLSEYLDGVLVGTNG